MKIGKIAVLTPNEEESLQDSLRQIRKGEYRQFDSVDDYMKSLEEEKK